MMTPSISILSPCICILLLFINQFDHQCKCSAFSIHSHSSTRYTPYTARARTLAVRQVHISLHSTSTPNDDDGDDGDADEEAPIDLPDLDASQLQWLEQRSQSSTSDQQQQDQADAEEEAAENLAGNVNIPKTGISINDEMTALQNAEKFLTQIFPLEKNGVAAIQTATVGTASDEPMRYIVPLNDYQKDGDADEDNDVDTDTDVDTDVDTTIATSERYAMIDVPPFSEDLVSQMKAFMGEKGSLSHILVTCRNGIHYDEAPAVYVTRKSDLAAWKKAFPSTNIVMYRLDIPRDCKSIVDQSLDGYGPWAFYDESGRFNETGRPLTIMEWDEDIQASVLDDGETPPDDEEQDLEDDYLYTPKAIKEREAGKEILAIYTPGHTYGSVTYIFPQSKVCCSGFTIPVEDTRAGASVVGIPRSAGPKLDYSGYLTTNSGGIDRQIASARHIASVYNDRFEVVLPARGPPVSLGGYSVEERSRILHDMLSEFAELGRVYGQMGIL